MLKEKASGLAIQLEEEIVKSSELKRRKDMLH